MQHSGCHDMCKMTIDANGTKHVVRTISATVVDPAKCADVIQ